MRLRVVFLFALNVLHAYQLGFQSKMHDNPIYRWRESLVIALSRMQPQPLHGYVGYGSILAYLTQHGLALIRGEADPRPSPADLTAVRAGAAVAVVVFACSTVTSFFYPTNLIAEVLVTWLVLFMLCAIYLPLTILFYDLRHEAPAAVAS